jgi:hypothetical protein
MTNAYDQAASLLTRFRAWIGSPAPKESDLVEIECESPITALVIGELHAVQYGVEGQEQTFFHRFQSNDRPLLLSSSDGRQIFVAQGRYEFTEAGFKR